MKPAVYLFLLVALLAGCTKSGGIGAEASSSLTPAVVALRQAAQAGDRRAAISNLSDLKLEVDRLNREGKLERQDASLISRRIAEVEQFVASMPQPPAPVTPAPVEASPPVQQDARPEAGIARQGKDKKEGDQGKDGPRATRGD